MKKNVMTSAIHTENEIIASGITKLYKRNDIYY